MGREFTRANQSEDGHLSQGEQLAYSSTAAREVAREGQTDHRRAPPHPISPHLNPATTGTDAVGPII